MHTTKQIWMAALTAVVTFTLPASALADDDGGELVVKQVRVERGDKWRAHGPVRGSLQPAAYDFYRASGELADAVRDAYRERGRYEDSALAAMERLNERAERFYDASNDQRLHELRNDFDVLRRAYDRAEDYFTGLPREGYVRNAVSRAQASMRNLSRTYFGLLESRPVGRPVPGPVAGQFALARQIEAAARELEGEAVQLYRAGFTRGDSRKVRIVLERLNEVTDRARDLRAALERRDNVQHNYNELREAFDDAEERYGVFGSHLTDEYARLGSLIRRFAGASRDYEYRVVDFR